LDKSCADPAVLLQVAEQAPYRVTGCRRSLNENRRNPELVGEFERFEISVVGGQIRAQETILLLQRVL
jgi:hypothetical protein